jgi:hypothetical protein
LAGVVDTPWILTSVAVAAETTVGAAKALKATPITSHSSPGILNRIENPFRMVNKPL